MLYIKVKMVGTAGWLQINFLRKCLGLEFGKTENLLDVLNIKNHGLSYDSYGAAYKQLF